MNSNIDIVDAFGYLKAEQAELKNKAEEIRLQLIGLGAGDYEGSVFLASVTMPTRATPDWKAVAAALLEHYADTDKNGWHAKLIKKHTEPKIVPTVTVKARKAA